MELEKRNGFGALADEALKSSDHRHHNCIQKFTLKLDFTEEAQSTSVEWRAMALAGALHVSPAASLPVTHSTRHQLRRAGAVEIGLQVNRQERRRVCTRSGSAVTAPLVRAMAESGTAGSRVEEKLGVRIEREPSEARLQELGTRSWPKWGCPASKFPWTYDGKETCYLLQGKVKVYPEGSSEFVEFGAGDLVVFPKGMSCTWEVSEAVDKHYIFDY